MIHQLWTKHKKISVSVVFLALIVAWYGYKSLKPASTKTTYMTSKAEIGTLIKSVSGSGQVSTSNQIDIKAKVAGDVVKVLAKTGDAVIKGAALIQLDASDAQKSVRDAQINLESAQIALAKLTQKTDAYTLLQAKNAITDAETSLSKLKDSQPIDLERAELTLQNARTALGQSHDSVYNAISAAFLDLPDIMTDINDTLLSYGISKALGQGEQNTNDYYLINQIPSKDFDIKQTLIDMIEQAEQNHKESKIAYDANFTTFKSTLRSADTKTLETLLDQTLETVKSASSILKQESNIFDYWVSYHSDRNHTIPAPVTQYQTDLGTWITQTNQLLSNLQDTQNTFKSNEDSATKAEQDLMTLKKNQPLDLAGAVNTVKIKKANLEDLTEGADKLDLQAQQLSVRKSTNALTDAQETLSDATIRAPFDGVVAAISVQIGDSVSSGGSVGTFITQQRIAEVTLNEVDMASVKVGQKATLAFDAIDGLTISGGVSNIDTIGAVSQGVVSYGIQISFDTQDDRVKSGMSVSTNIIVASKTDALLVPSEAVTANEDGKTGTVEILVSGSPVIKNVEIGLSNDTSTEIVSGINEGDLVVTQTITGTTSTKAATTSTRSIFQSLGGGGPPR